ncbi:MAG: hypothetical protein JSU90_01755, partial [Nitrospiraceae bacterium]
KVTNPPLNSMVRSICATNKMRLIVMGTPLRQIYGTIKLYYQTLILVKEVYAEKEAGCGRAGFFHLWPLNQAA